MTQLAKTIPTLYKAGDPGLSEDSVQQGYLWINTTTKANFYCADPTIGAQVWTPLASQITQFTPTIVGSTIAGTGTYTRQAGYYVISGLQVILSTTITWTAHTGTGNMIVTGFPIPIKNLTSYRPVGSVLLENITFSATIQGLLAIGDTNATTIQLYGSVSGSTHVSIPMSNAGTVRMTIGYIQ